MITAMEIAAYIFFFLLLGGSFIIGAWLEGSEKSFWKKRKEENEKGKVVY